MAGQHTATSHQRHQFSLDDNNISRSERLATGILGGIATIYGLTRLLQQPLATIPLAAAGSSMVVRALRGHSRLYQTLGVQVPAKGSPLAERMPSAIVFEHAVTIQRKVEDVFSEWLKVEELPRYIDNILSVTKMSNTATRWVVQAPGGMELVWDAEMTVDRKEHLIVWHSTKIADIRQEGFVLFSPAPGNRGTELVFQMAYRVRGGRLTMLLGKALRKEPSYQIREALRKFKQFLEAGEIATTKGQPSGRETPEFQKEAA